MESTTTTTSTTITIPTTTTTTLSPEAIAQAEYEVDVQAIKQLWRRHSDSWFNGVDAGVAYMVEHNYSGEGCTAEDFQPDEFVEGYQEEIVVDESTIERDDGWTVPGGRAAGDLPPGRVYIMSVTISYIAPGYETSQETLEVHAAVDNSEAYYFFSCDG